MTESVLSTLRSRLASRYSELRGRLERSLGSQEDAADAMQETWLRLEAMTEVGPVHNTDAYLLRMASNIATDAYRRSSALLNGEELDQIMGLADENDDPVRVVSAQKDVEALQIVLARLPVRRRAILISARLDGLLNSEIAERFNLSLSSVEKELRHAMRYCKKHLPELEAAEQSSILGPRKF